VNMAQEPHDPSCPYALAERYRVALEAIERHTREHCEHAPLACLASLGEMAREALGVST
jgi:hypothetical protein